MSENMKSGIVLLAALLLGGLLIAGLVQQVGQQRGEKPAPQARISEQPASRPQPAPSPKPAENTVALPVTVNAPAPVAQAVRAEEAPTVDFFGKPLTAFDRQVNERVGIAGQVVMAERPVSGATVLLRRVSKKIADGAPDYTGVAADPQGGQEWTTTTDNQGKYAFYGLDEGHYGLQAYTDTACGVEDMTIRGGSIPGRYPGKPSYFAARGELAIELWPSGALSGTVLTPEGQPVAGASLYPYQMQYPTGSVEVEPIPQVFLSVQTGADGAFRFPRLPAGRWQLAVRAEGYADQTTEWLSTAAPSAEIRLKKLKDGTQPAGPVAINAPVPADNPPPTAPPVEDNALDGVIKLNLDLGFDYSSEGFPMGLGAGQSDAQSTGERPCKKLTAEPACHSRHVYYGYLRLGNAEDNRFVFAIDESDKSPWFGHFDRNNNSDLTDDGPPCIISADVEFDVAVVLPNGKTVRRPYKIWQWPNSQSSTPCIRFYAVCHYQAKIHLNGETVTAVAFEQYNHDGLYHDDGIWLDLNGDNRLDEKTELFKDGGAVTLKGKPFRIKLDYP